MVKRSGAPVEALRLRAPHAETSAMESLSHLRAPPPRSRSHRLPPSPVQALPWWSPPPSISPGWRVLQPGLPSQALPRWRVAAHLPLLLPRARQQLPPASPRRPVAVAAGRRTTRATRRSPELPGSTTASFGLALSVVVARLVAAGAVVWARQHSDAARWQRQRGPQRQWEP